MLTNLQYRILKRIAPTAPSHMSGAVYDGKSKLGVLMGADFFDRIRGKVVVDFGCGQGSESIEMAHAGAKRVIGIDIREEMLEAARRKAQQAGVEARCQFATVTDEQADVVVSLDSFEHFEDPAAILRIMSGLMHPNGEVLVSFGPTWYHPLGGHTFSVFPWAHLVFSENALIQWRSTFKSDGARRFAEVSGGLNQMTIARFRALVAASPLAFDRLELVPIRALRSVHNRLTREFTTAIVRCRLVRRR
jgi:SAM-dependent methyltransferase